MSGIPSKWNSIQRVEIPLLRGHASPSREIAVMTAKSPKMTGARDVLFAVITAIHDTANRSTQPVDSFDSASILQTTLSRTDQLTASRPPTMHITL